MQQDQKPIKRSKELVHLSREHHEGLLFGWKLRQGVSYKIDSERIADFCKWFWIAHLHQHFSEEEREFGKLLPAKDLLLHKMISDHREIEKSFDLISSTSGNEEFMQLAALLTDHIRFEERELFNYIEEHSSPEILSHIHHSRDHSLGTVWKDEFWVKAK